MQAPPGTRTPPAVSVLLETARRPAPAASPVECSGAGAAVSLCRGAPLRTSYPSAPRRSTLVLLAEMLTASKTETSSRIPSASSRSFSPRSRPFAEILGLWHKEFRHVDEGQRVQPPAL